MVFSFWARKLKYPIPETENSPHQKSKNIPKPRRHPTNQPPTTINILHPSNESPPKAPQSKQTYTANHRSPQNSPTTKPTSYHPINPNLNNNTQINMCEAQQQKQPPGTNNSEKTAWCGRRQEIQGPLTPSKAGGKKREDPSPLAPPRGNPDVFRFVEGYTI